MAGIGGGLDLGVREEGVTVDLWNSHVGNEWVTVPLVGSAGEDRSTV